MVSGEPLTACEMTLKKQLQSLFTLFLHGAPNKLTREQTGRYQQTVRRNYLCQCYSSVSYTAVKLRRHRHQTLCCWLVPDFQQHRCHKPQRCQHTIQRAVISAKRCNGGGHQDMQSGESHFYRYQINQYNYAGGCQLQQSGNCCG